MDFLKYLYSYFVPDNPDASSSHTARMKAANVRPSPGKTLIPVYNNQGQLIKFIETSQDDEPVGSKLSNIPAGGSAENVASLNPKYKHAPDVPLPSREFIPSTVKSAIPLPEVKVSVPPMLSAGIIDWDGWPTGIFERDFTYQEFEETAGLRVHWATRVNGGDRKGDEHAGSWESGKKSSRTCLGVLECDNPMCSVVIRPHTKASSLDKQLRTPCKCGAVLSHRECNVMSYLWKWKGGVHYSHNGFHTHRRPTHLLHLLPNEQRRFEELVKANPKSGPLQLIVGVPGLEGPRESVADISDVLLNAGRVSKERQKVKKTVQTADGLIASFSKFARDHPNFIIHSQFDEATVISVQTNFMRSQLVKESRLDGPVNGMVNDAAHGWWKERNSLLMVSSTYCPDLLCWVPGVMSFTNGATEEHFEHHFLAVMQSIAREAESRGMDIVDELFAGVMDFSQAERGGFIRAFIKFWSMRPENKRTRQELQVAAERLLKGCREHFRAGVVRISKISGVIPPHMRDEFVARALALLDVPSSEDFIALANLLVRDFPKTKSWMDWWIRPSVASMLFESERKMDADLWDSLPADNNAEEAMHWKLYSACGRDHELLEGFYALYAVAVYYERLHSGAREGKLIRYGQAEPWKVVQQKIGRTKKSRAKDLVDKKQKKNDGRPPDTSKELLGTKPKPKKATQSKKIGPPLPSKSTNASPNKTPHQKSKSSESKTPNTTPVLSSPSYPWDRNSCWLDTSLQLLYVAVLHSPFDFMTIEGALPKNSSLRQVISALLDRYYREQALIPAVGDDLAKARDDIRTMLKKTAVISSVSQYNSLYPWFTELIRHENQKASYRAVAAFEFLLTEIHECSGSEEIGGRHVEVVHLPSRQRLSQVSRRDYERFEGDFGRYIEDMISLDHDYTAAPSCWRVKDGVPLCTGTRRDLRRLVLSVPILLTFELGHEDVSLDWNFPSVIKLSGLVYDLIGLALVNEDRNHFIARYASSDRQTIYTYDDTKYRGSPVQEPDAHFQTHMAGRNIRLPDGFIVWQVFYFLRGGLDAQKSFFMHRAQALRDEFGLNVSTTTLDQLPSVTFDSDDLVELPARARHWLFNAFKMNTKEYVSQLDPDENLSDGEDLGPESEDTINSQDDLIHADLVSVTDSSDSLPDSLFGLDCRCGMVGDGNIFYQPEQHGTAIQCTGCDNWSHIACQRDGRASNLGKDENFICDYCDPTFMLPARRKSDRAVTTARKTRSAKPLHDRLIAGRGALARVGEYWYPVRLIERAGPTATKEYQWTVEWWREIIFPADVSLVPGNISLVNETDILDSLWLKQKERRGIRLGRWKHAYEVETSEDILADPSRVPYSADVDDALSPFKDVLKLLLEHRIDELGGEIIPAKDWLEKNTKSPLFSTLVPYVGSLSVIERAQISNWFDIHIGKRSKKARLAWLGYLPHAHAHTLYIAQRLKRSPETAPLSHAGLLHRAWDIQFTGISERIIDVDVAKECLYILEEEMFEVSIRAGKAGFYQWGLDAGHHQDGWDVYVGLRDANTIRPDALFRQYHEAARTSFIFGTPPLSLISTCCILYPTHCVYLVPVAYTGA